MVDRITGAVLALFYLSGRYSLADSDDWVTHAPMFYEVRFWALLALSALALTYSPPRSDWRRRVCPISAYQAVGLAILLPLYVAMSSLWSADLEWSMIKAMEAALLAVACICIIPYFKAGRIPALRRGFWLALVAVTGLMGLLACFVVDSTRLSVLGGGPNTFGRNMGLLFLGSLYFQRQSPATTAWRWYPLMALALLMVVLSGSRGALLATSVGGVVYLLIDSRYRTRNIVAVGCFLILLNILLISTDMGRQALAMFQQRIMIQTIEQQHASGRLEHFAAAYDLGSERPWFGQGLAGYKILLGYNYPHNLVLELFCETGVFGVALLTLLLLNLLRFVTRYRRFCDPAIWGAFALVLSSAMFSGDFFDSRGIFLMAMLGSQEIVARRRAAPPPRQPAPSTVLQGVPSPRSALPAR